MSKTFKEYLMERSIGYVNSLMIPRFKMPQISQENIDDYLDFLKHRGIKSKELSLSLDEFKEIKPTQSKYKDEKVQKMVQFMNNEPNEFFDCKLIISNDGYLLDGHHRYSAICGIDELDRKIDVIEIDTDVENLLRLSDLYPMSFKQGINE